MKISRDSWHYKFMQLLRVDPHSRYTLCDYVRGFMWAIIKAAFFLFMGSLVLGGVALILTCMVAAAWSVFQLLPPGWNDEIIIGTALWAAVGLCLLVIGFAIAKEELPNYLNKKFPRRTCPRRYENRQPSVFVQWIKDRHSKVCRFIEFV